METKVPDSLVEKLKSRWLDEFTRLGLVEDACIAIGVKEGTVWKWRREDPKFSNDWDYVRRVLHVPLLEEALMKRALSGKTDIAIIMALKSLKPDLYDEKARAAPVQNGIQISIVDVDGKVLGEAQKKSDVLGEIADAVVVNEEK